jgi:hypothetical protein
MAEVAMAAAAIEVDGPPDPPLIGFTAARYDTPARA